MFFFVIKKSFFDFWDHFLPSVLINLGFIIVLAVPTLVPGWFPEGAQAVSVVVFALGILLLFVYTGAASLFARDIADYQSLEWSAIRGYLSRSWKYSVALGALYLLHAFLLSVALPVYVAMGTVFSLAALAFLFWASVIWLVASAYYLPVAARLDSRIPRILRKSFLLFFDNTGFSVMVAMGALLLSMLSVFTALLIPGVMGVLTWIHTAAKLRLYKYDYLEANPNANRREIPWDDLLFDDRERVGKRTFRGMIFPWKE